MKVHNRSGFTLLEIIIVVIIIGVLASLALPRMFATVEYSRSTEALSAFATIRSALERCYLMNNGSYENCELETGGDNTLDIPDPADSPNAHFKYSVSSSDGTDYTILAQRNNIDGGNETDLIGMNLTGQTLTRAGNGAYSAIGNSNATWLTTF